MHNALGTLKGVPQWFLWSLTWDAAAAKYKKAPCPLDGSARNIDASLPTNWTTYDAACAALTLLPRIPERTFALGFWLTTDCGVFLLDLDNCTDTNGTLTPFATQMVAAFPGAMVEWSSSRRGVHVIGRAVMPSHRSRDVHKLGMELYHCNRGIAFGLSGEANGSADTRHDATILQLVMQYFPPRADGEGGERRPEWRGPVDDDELIRRMLAARVSAAAAFGGKASLPQLWAGEVERNSDNDMALASHLAFWTGCDAERMTRLMLRSGMVRPKWHEHRTYLSITIDNACAACTNVYQEPERKVAPQLQPSDVRNGAALMQRVFPPVQWAVHGLIPQGTAILSAAPKSGKSWLVLQACIAVAGGVSLWEGRNPEAPGETLYLDLEGNDRRLQERIAGLMKSFPSGMSIARFHYETEWPRAQAGVDRLREFLREHPECRMVVIDTLATFRDPDPGRMSAYAADYAVGEMLKPLTREFPVAIVLVTHTRKQSAGNAMDKISGTQGLVGGVDNYMILERGNGDMDAELIADGRDIKDRQELALRIRANGGWSCVGKSADIKRSNERSDVLKALASIGGVGTPRDIRAALDDCVTPGTLHTRLSRMVKAGEILKSGKLYTLISMKDHALKLPPLPGA